MGDGLDTMKYYKEKSKVRHGAPTSEVGLTMNGEIAVGKFVDRDRPDYQSLLHARWWNRWAIVTSSNRILNPRRHAHAAN